MSWSRLPRTFLCAALLAVVLAGCGFKPLYRQNRDSDPIPQFAQIAIAQPEDRASQQLRNHLLDILTPYGAPDRPRYLLEYRITETVGSVFVTRSEEITRNNLQLSVSCYLRDYEGGTVIFSMAATSQASYNVTQADYTNLVSEKNARERALRDAAEQIRLRLGNFFDRKPQMDETRQRRQQGTVQ
jgi:LPS-assembly lipoprotein